MLDNATRYIYEIYREKSVSQAAKKLFISQAALSSSLKKAEEELGFCIFNRKTLPFTLTPEGKVYIDSIEKMLEIEKETLGKIEDITDFRNGTVRIGSANHLSTFAIPKVCRVFRQLYPSVDVSILLSKTDELETMLKKEECDLVFTSSKLSDGAFTARPLFAERFAVVMRSDSVPSRLEGYALTHKDITHRSYTSDKIITDLELFNGVEFVHSPPYSNTYKVKTQLFGDKGAVPHVTSNTLNLRLNFNLTEAGFGAFFSTDAVIATLPESKNCAYFVIEATQTFDIVYNSTSHSYRLIKEFVDTAARVFDHPSPLTELCNMD